MLTTDSNALAAGDSLQIEFTVNVSADEGPLSNSAEASGELFGFTGLLADDGSDPDTDADGNPDTTANVAGGARYCHNDNSTYPSSVSLSMTKVADNQGPHNIGDVVTYTYTVTNDGEVNIDDVAITDTHNGSDPAPTTDNETLLTDTAPTGDSIEAAIDGSWDLLAPGDTITFTGNYTVTVDDVDNL